MMWCRQDNSNLIDSTTPKSCSLVMGKLNAWDKKSHPIHTAIVGLTVHTQVEYKAHATIV